MGVQFSEWTIVAVCCVQRFCLVEATHMVTIMYNLFYKIRDGGGGDYNMMIQFLYILFYPHYVSVTN